MDRFEQSKEVFNQLFGPLPEDEVDPELMEILRRFIFGDVFHTGELDHQTRELITVTILATLQTIPQLKAHLFSCINVGVSPVELREAIYQLAPFIGFPRTLNAIEALNELFGFMKIDAPLPGMATVEDDQRYDKGLEIQRELYGSEIEDKFDYLEAIPKFHAEFIFGDFYTRDGMEIQTRELLKLVTLTALGTSGIKECIQANLKLGTTKETLYETIIQCIPYVGFPQCVDVIEEINKI
ncbi:carboxymuconolactone decarboxylase family protein [Methanobrevibacter sp.]|uniref:carboxymuconolactone decarboxylase family protein n=1 Tax=Methanobrevibacter sp. TaxID=66852 RepID=UPI003870BF5A